MIGWLYHWGKRAPLGCRFAGALSIPRELTLTDGVLKNYPVQQARPLLRTQSPYVQVQGSRLKKVRLE